MKTMWRIQANMRNEGYDLLDCVGKTSYWCVDKSDRDSYLSYRGWYVDSHTKFSKSQFPFMICSSSSNISPSYPQLYLHLRTRS